MVGTHAGDMIGEIALAIEMSADAVDIGKAIHPHPTLGESIGMRLKWPTAAARTCRQPGSRLCVSGGMPVFFDLRQKRLRPRQTGTRRFIFLRLGLQIVTLGQ